ncbi:MAG TPA: LysR substrate-binding domain-containing protein [Lysobacter sp.]
MASPHRSWREPWSRRSESSLIAKGFDAANDGGFEPSQGVVARTLAPAHVIAVASPDYMKGRRKPANPEDLAEPDGIVMRSLRNAAGESRPAELRQQLAFDDPAAMTRAAVLGLGITRITVPDALPLLHSGANPYCTEVVRRCRTDFAVPREPDPDARKDASIRRHSSKRNWRHFFREPRLTDQPSRIDVAAMSASSRMRTLTAVGAPALPGQALAKAHRI